MNEIFAGFDNVWGWKMLVPACVLGEGILHVFVRDPVPVGVPVEKAVATDGIVGEYRRADGYVRLDRSRGADPQDGKLPVVLLDLPCLEIHIRQSVKLCHHDVAVVSPDSRGEDCEALSVVSARDGYEFAAGVSELHVREIVTDHVHSPGIAYKYHYISKFFGTKMNMEGGAVGVDYKF